MANRFFNPTPLLVVDGDLAVAADLNDVSGATEVAFDTVEGEIDAFVPVTVGLAATNAQQVDQTEASTATAGTVALGVATLRHLLTGTTTVTGFTGTAGVMYTCRAEGAFLLTHNATDLIITQTGANITTAAGDTFDVQMITGIASRIVNFQRASGIATRAVGLAATNVLQADQTEASTATWNTLVLGTATLRHLLTGTTTINWIEGTAGVTYHCRAEGAFLINHDSGKINITQTGANITTAAGDTFDVQMITDVTCRIVNYIRANGTAALAPGATTEVLVGGGTATLPVWTTATGSGAPVRATSPTLVTPTLGVATATSVDVTGGQIKFPATQAPSADVNTLDDYKEGTWTPVLAFGGASVSLTYNSQVGSYTKVGNRVMAQAYVALSAKGTSEGLATISLPLTSKNTTNLFSCAALRANLLTYTGVAQGFVRPNTALLELNVHLDGDITNMTHANFGNISTIILSVTYEV